jgi:hypothetical protein
MIQEVLHQMSRLLTAPLPPTGGATGPIQMTTRELLEVAIERAGYELLPVSYWIYAGVDASLVSV